MTNGKINNSVAFAINFAFAVVLNYSIVLVFFLTAYNTESD